MKIIAIILGTIAVAIILFRALNRKEYSLHDWEDQQKEDFKKYGPLPDDIDNNKTH